MDKKTATPKLYNPKVNSNSLDTPSWLIQIPIKLLSLGAKFVYGRISKWCDDDGTCYRSIPCLSQELGMCESSIEKYLKELKDKKLIGTFHPQAGGVNHYEFYEHPWMKEPIVKELCYKNDPPYKHTAPPVQSYGTPPYKHTDINIKEKEINNIKEKIYKKESAPPPSAPSGGTSPDGSQITKYEYQDTLYPVKKERARNLSTVKSSSSLTIDDMLSCNPFSIPEQSLLDWIEVRKKKKAPITLTAWDILHKELRKFKDAGFDVTEQFNTMVANGWASVKFAWLTTKKVNVESSNYYGEPTKGFLKGLKETPWDEEPIHGF